MIDKKYQNLNYGSAKQYEALVLNVKSLDISIIIKDRIFYELGYNQISNFISSAKS